MPAVLNGPENLLVRVALFDCESGVYQSEFRWPALERLGPNDYGGAYAQVTLRFGRVRWSFEMGRDGERVILLVRALDDAPGVQVRLETLYLDEQQDAAARVVTQEREVVARRGGAPNRHDYRRAAESPLLRGDRALGPRRAQ
jgi:hypothetical protein